MPRRGLLTLAMGAMILLGATGCTGFLRGINSDNQVEWESTVDHYLFDSRDLTLSLPGEWDYFRGGIDRLPGSSEYDTTLTSDDVQVRYRAEVERGQVVACGTELVDELTAQGWQLVAEVDQQVAGQRGVGFTGTRDGRFQQALCFRSDQGAKVYLIVSVPAGPQAPDQIAALLDEALVWKS